MELSYQIPMARIKSQSFLNKDIIKCEEYYLVDKNNKRYVDFRSGLWNVPLGYSGSYMEKLKLALCDQIDNGMFYLDSHSYRTELYQCYSERLLSFLNKGDSHFDRVFFTNSGSESTELALKLVKKANETSKKKKIIVFKEGYHGTFFGGMSLSGIDSYINEEYGNNRMETVFMSAPTDEHKFNKILDFIESHYTEIAAFFIEPLVSSGGALTISNSHLELLLKVCRSHQIITIFDEIATGFFRTKSRMYFHKLKSSPDIILISKALNNGVLPFGSVIASKEITNRLTGKYLDHFSTQNGNLLGIRLAYETLDYFMENESEIINVIEKFEATWKTFQNRLSITGQGAIFSVLLDSHTETHHIMERLKDLGYLVYFFECYENSGLLLLPSYILPVEELENILQKIVDIKSI
ncbi:aminotransferase class III-fold pyridoxal phosphate-dependent enzyme [Streptococcus ruminantium]|uniref:aminotransferase class III-fold pyridoxal phosphate-dependent enzyme n=1 Tax=Streptococcus ruminantium TaxID=1917441 RepID=UPI0012DD9E01|nr:aminotransferase class III-fold pyridoxal phosphate-dependent enzyme [Streptococcus ruminantium]